MILCFRRRKNIEDAKPWHVVAVQNHRQKVLCQTVNTSIGCFIADCGCMCGNVAGHSDAPQKEYKYLYNPKTMKLS